MTHGITSTPLNITGCLSDCPVPYAIVFNGSDVADMSRMNENTSDNLSLAVYNARLTPLFILRPYIVGLCVNLTFEAQWAA